MLQRLTNLLFGSAIETTQEPTVQNPASPEVVEDDWLLVNAVDGEMFPEPSERKLIGNLSSSEKCAASLVSDASITDPEVPVARSGGRASQRLVSQSGALVKVTQVGRVQRAQARANRHHLSRSGIQRQNYTRQRLPQHFSRRHCVVLHQPASHNFSH